MYLSPNAIGTALQNRMATHPSAALVASTPTAFESWFRVELALAVLGLGFSSSDLVFKYDYPVVMGTRPSKADFAVMSNWGHHTYLYELKARAGSADPLEASPGPILNVRLN